MLCRGETTAELKGVLGRHSSQGRLDDPVTLLLLKMHVRLVVRSIHSRLCRFLAPLQKPTGASFFPLAPTFADADAGLAAATWYLSRDLITTHGEA